MDLSSMRERRTLNENNKEVIQIKITYEMIVDMLKGKVLELSSYSGDKQRIYRFEPPNVGMLVPIEEVTKLRDMAHQSGKGNLLDFINSHTKEKYTISEIVTIIKKADDPYNGFEPWDPHK